MTTPAPPPAPAPTSRGRRRRGRKKRITLTLAPVAALALIIPLMNQAGAATPSQVSNDCASDSSALEDCEFFDVQSKVNSLGPNERVSAITDNCGSATSTTNTFNVSASVTRTVQLEEGHLASADSKLGGSIFDVGIKYNTFEINITRDDKTTTMAFSRTDTVQPDSIGYFMWSAKRTDVSGYLKATYKEEQDGQKVFFSPSEGAATVHVFYPQILNNGTPDGRLWLRSVKCEASDTDGVQDPEDSVDTESGFGEGGGNVTDTEIPLSEISGS